MKDYKDLISLSDYVLEIDSKASFGGHYDKIVRYTKFLKQPLKLSMFIPCVDEKPLEKPESLKGYYETDKQGMIDEFKLRKQYNKASNNVIFEGFTFEESKEVIDLIKNDNYYLEYHKMSKTFNVVFDLENELKTIEDLTHLNIKAKY